MQEEKPMTFIASQEIAVQSFVLEDPRNIRQMDQEIKEWINSHCAYRVPITKSKVVERIEYHDVPNVTEPSLSDPSRGRILPLIRTVTLYLTVYPEALD